MVDHSTVRSWQLSRLSPDTRAADVRDRRAGQEVRAVAVRRHDLPDHPQRVVDLGTIIDNAITWCAVYNINIYTMVRH